MKAKLLSVGVMLALAPGFALAEGLASQPNDEVCIALAVAMIRGDQAVKDEAKPLLEERNETCAPAEMYLKIAEARLQFLNAQQQGQANAALEEQQRKSDRDARIRAAGQAWLIYQAQQDAIRRNNAPKTTTCRTFAGTTTCETR